MMSVRPPRARSSLRAGAGIALVAMLYGTAAPAEIVRGFKETWPGTSIQGWDGQAEESNPGTGGHGGAGDGFLLISRSPAAQLGARSSNPAYVGSYIDGQVTQIRLWVSDLDSEEPIEVHLSLGSSGNFWQYNIGIQPVANTWTEYVVDLSTSAQWTQLIGAGSPGATFQAALEHSDRLHLRHDVAPFSMSPDPIAGDFGIDDLELTFDPVPTTTVRWGTLKTLYRDPR